MALISADVGLDAETSGHSFTERRRGRRFGRVRSQIDQF